MPKEVLFNLLGFSFIASTLMSNNKKSLNFKNIWLGIIFIYLVISFCFYFYLPMVLGKNGGNINWNLWAVRPFINIVLSLWMIQALVEYTDTLRRWVGISKMLCWVAFGFSIFSFCNLNTTFGNANITANFIAMLSPICLMFKDLRYKIIYALCFIAILLTHSSLSVVAFAFGLFVYLILTKKWKSLLCLIVLSVVFVMYKKVGFFSDSGRLEMWKNVLGYCKNTMWLGKGLGNFAVNRYTPLSGDPTVALSSHSELFQILHDNGLFMVALIGIYLIDLFRHIFFAKSNILIITFTSAFVSYLVICLGNFPLRIAPLALVGITYIAALEAILIKGEE